MSTRSLWPIIILAAVGMIAAPGPARAAKGESPPIVLTAESPPFDVIAHAKILDDPDGRLEIDDVAHGSTFRGASPETQPPADGFRWYKLRVVLPPQSAGRWYLAANKTCNDADLYSDAGNGTFTHIPFGYRVSFGRHPAPTLNLTAIALPNLWGQTLFVRLRCDSYQDLSIAAADQLDSAYGGLHGPGTYFDAVRLALALVTAGLALIARSRAYALLSLITFVGLLRSAMNHFFPQSFPALVPPPYVFTQAVLTGCFFVAQWLFYTEFFGLRKHHKGLSGFFLASLLATLVALVSTVMPLTLVGNALASSLSDVPPTVFYAAATAIAIQSGRQGNRSAWFVAFGSMLFTLYALSEVVNAATNVSGWWSLFDYFWPTVQTFDIMLFIIAVGDELRQTSLAYTRTLQRSEAAQAERMREQQQHIADIERHNAAFARFVPREFLDQLAKSDVVDVRLGDYVERNMAILFTDIRGFTSIAERQSPGETFAFLNAYLARAGPVIRANGGFIDKYVGDAIVALFPNRPGDALDAAIALQSEVRRFNEERARAGAEPLTVGIGVNYGRMILGTIGETERYETTVIADSVNVASRLESLTKVYGVSIITSQALVESLPDRAAYCLRLLGEIALRGHQRVENAYEVFDGDPYELVLHKRRTVASFARALALLRAADYARSAELFAELVQANPLDRAAAYLRDYGPDALAPAASAESARDDEGPSLNP